MLVIDTNTSQTKKVGSWLKVDSLSLSKVHADGLLASKTLLSLLDRLYLASK